MVKWTPQVCVPHRLWVPRARQLPGRGWRRGAGLGADAFPPALAACPALLAPSPALSQPVFLFQVPAIEEHLLDDKHLLKPWDAKKVGMAPSPLPSLGWVLLGPALSPVLIPQCTLLSSAGLILLPTSVL